jgi:hypothetical protein
MDDQRDIESLNLGELDVEALEKRLEMVEPGTTEGYYCGTDCTDYGFVVRPMAQPL